MSLSSPPAAPLLLFLVGEGAVALADRLTCALPVRCRPLAGGEVEPLLVRVREESPDLILVDAGSGGAGVIEALQASGLPGLPAIVAVSDHPDPEAVALLFERGVCDVVQPAQGERLLLARLNRLLAARRQHLAREGLVEALRADLAEQKARLAVQNQQIGTLTALIKGQSRELREARRYFMSILSHLPLPVLVVDAEGRCLHWNPAGERAFGVKQADCIGRSDLWRFFYDQPTELLAQQIARGDFSPESSPYHQELTTLGEQEIYVLERHFPSLDRHLSVTASPIRDEDGRVVGAIETVADITAIKQREQEALRLRQQAQSATESKSRFLANMSHEIRTPMNAIIGMVDLCLKTRLDERQARYLSKIKLASESLLHIINEILDFSKIEAGKLELEEAPFVLENVFDQLSAVLALRAEQQGIELNYDIEDDSRVLGGDPLRLGQVLINIVSNAIKFSAGGRVIVRVRDRAVTPENVELLFSIEDNGIGMSAAQVEKLFQPFAQADASTTRKYGGTGLGLAISNLIVQQMGGRIWVESELGRGSTFHFTVRFHHLRPDRRSGIAALATQLAEQRDRPVLIVDDNRVSREIIARIVGHLGLPVCPADSGEAALHLVETHAGPPFLAAFIDWKMPGLNGLETIDRLRAALGRGAGRVPPMILVTAYSHHEELRDLVGHIDSLLAKPVSARQLYVELSNCLGLSREPVVTTERRGTQIQNWAPFRGLDILVAEDIEVNREVIGELLASVGLTARFAENGQQALEAVRSQCPDIVLMDCQMPVMDGYEATRQLRAQPETAQLPIVALTANASFEDKARCHFVGMNAHIAKPFRLEDIYRQLMYFFPSLATQASDVGGVPLPAVPVEAPLAFAGIEVAVGLSQTGGKVPMYLRVLKKYRDTHVRQFEAEYRQAGHDGDRMTCIRLVHSLKGVSLMLGATGVGDAAARLEHCLREGSEADSPAALAALCSELAVVAASLATLERHEASR